MRKLYCYSYKEFKGLPAIPERTAIISIIGTQAARGRHLYSGPNVLNLDFDDVIEPTPGLISFSSGQAQAACQFIKAAIQEGYNIYIHCEAGLSRSQAFVRFIEKNWGDIDWETRASNPCIYYNIDVLNKLDRELRKDYYGDN